jgi:hypothetical protein
MAGMSRHHIATITPQWSQMYSILTECTSPLGSLGTFSGEQLTEAASHGATPALMGLSKEQLAQIASGHASPLPPYAAYSPLVVLDWVRHALHDVGTTSLPRLAAWPSRLPLCHRRHLRRATAHM